MTVTLLHPKTGRWITVSDDTAQADGLWLDETLYFSDEDRLWIKENLNPEPLLELMAELA